MARAWGITVLLAVCLASFAAADFCHGSPDPNAKPNLNPIITTPPTFLKSTTNGKLYQIQPGTTKISVVHVWGTPYQMGYAYGTLLKDQLNTFLPSLWSYMESQVDQVLQSLPPWLQNILANLGLDAALDVTWEITKDFTGPYFFEELHGIADASGVSYDMAVRVHMIGELTKGACSMYGAWGEATLHNTTLQLRALDWDTTGPFKDFPTLTVYHPSSGNGHTFANLGFVGWIGSITGMSSTQMAISEIGVSFPDETFGAESRIGTPFTFLLRDILQFDKTLDDSIDSITSAHRTCDLILGVGDGKLKQFRGFEYSYSVANVFDDENMMPNATWHPRIPNTVYWGMDWLCPGFSSVLGRQLKAYHGTLTPELTISHITAIVQTGDLHIAVYDLTNMLMWVSYAAPSTDTTGPKYAYDRQFMRLDMKALFSEKPPSQDGVVIN